MCTDNYSNIEIFDKVIVKIKWCSLFASQFSSSFTKHDVR